MDRDRFRDRQGAVAGGIETVYFAARRGLRDRAGESFAGRGAAARVDVVAGPRDPGPARLSICGGAAERQCRHNNGEHEQRPSGNISCI